MPTPAALTTVTAAASDARAWIDRLWSSIADRGRLYAPVPAASVHPLERARQLAASMLSGRGEASGAALARELLEDMRALSPDDRAAFLAHLAEQFDPDPDALQAAAAAYLADPSADRASALSSAAEPPRQELLRRMNMAPGGTAALVAMRHEVLDLLRGHPQLRPLDRDLKHLFGSWFNRGFLELRRIDWQTPAAVLEKLIAYEAVHEIQGWHDLRRRLAPDRRCFAFFHPALPGDPLIFVEVALTEGLATAVQPLLAAHEGEGREGEGRAMDAAHGRALRADSAIFYSISNCQEGLRGISFGNFLIKQVVEELKAELPGLRRFSTLSPVPGFRRWLARKLDSTELAPLRPGDAEALQALPDDWWADPAVADAVRPVLLRLCAAYLTRPNAGLGAIDPVARFHLGNGARLEQVNWPGNTSVRGIAESYGVMVNYLYDPDDIEANHEAFVRSGTVVRSAAVDALLAPPEPPAKPRPPRSG